MVVEDTPQSGQVEQVISELQSGERHPVDDADSADGIDGLQAVELVHETPAGAVVLHYNYYTSYRPADGGPEEFDIYDQDTSEAAAEGQGE